MGCCSSINNGDDKENLNNQVELKNKEIEEKYSIIKPTQVIDGIDVYENNFLEILGTLNSIKLCPKCKKLFCDNEVNNLLESLNCIATSDEKIKKWRYDYFVHIGNYDLTGDTNSLLEKDKLKKLIDEQTKRFNESLNVDTIITCKNENCKYKMRFKWKIERPPITDPLFYDDSLDQEEI